MSKKKRFLFVAVPLLAIALIAVTYFTNPSLFQGKATLVSNSTGLCQAVKSGVNNKYDTNRVNVVYVGVNFGREYGNNLTFSNFKDWTKRFTDYGGGGYDGYYGLASTEPFKSNIDKFNFWYLDKNNIKVDIFDVADEILENAGPLKFSVGPITYSFDEDEVDELRDLVEDLPSEYENIVAQKLWDLLFTFDLDQEFADDSQGLFCRDICNTEFDDISSVAENCKLSATDNIQVVNLCNFRCRSSANKSEQQNFVTILDSDAKDPKSSRIVTNVHEFGHAFGGLLDEYGGENKNTKSDLSSRRGYDKNNCVANFADAVETWGAFVGMKSNKVGTSTEDYFSRVGYYTGDPALCFDSDGKPLANYCYFTDSKTGSSSVDNFRALESSEECLEEYESDCMYTSKKLHEAGYAYKCKDAGKTTAADCSTFTKGKYAANGCEGSYNTMRPTMRSIMNRNRFPQKGSNGPTPFGPVNEFYLCEEILERTGSLGSYCVELCEKVEANSGVKPGYCAEI